MSPGVMVRDRKAEAQFKDNNSTDTLIRRHGEFKDPSHAK